MFTRQGGLIFILLAIGLFLIRAPFLEVPLERDEGEYAYLAWQMDYGVMPYRDIVTYISPGVFFLYRCAFFVCERTVKGIRLFTLWYLLLSLGVFCYLAKQLLGSKSVWLAGIIFIFLTTDPSILANMSQREIFVLLPLMISFIFLQKDLVRPQWLLAAGNGLAMGLAFMIKPTAVFHLFFVLAVWAWYYFRSKDYKLFWSRIFWLAAGLVGGLVPFILYFNHQKAWPEFLYWNFIFPKVQSQAITASFSNHNYFWEALSYHCRYTFKGILVSHFSLVFLLLLALIITLFKRRKELAWYWLWFFSLLLSTATGWHFRSQYFQLLIPAQALLIAWVIQYIYRRLLNKNHWLRSGYYAFATLLVLFPLVSLVKQYHFISPEMISRKLYVGQIFSMAKTIGRYVARHTAPADKIYILGSEPEIYFYSQRTLVGTHITAYTLTYAYGDPAARQKEVIQALKKNLPPYLIKVNMGSSLYDYPAVSKDNPIFNEVFNLVDQHYVLDGFGYCSSNRGILVLGRREVKNFTRGSKSLRAEWQQLYNAFGDYDPAVLIFRRQDYCRQRGN
ncbi:MAG: hypothetical protein HY920_03950 [Elusimicrobia bacterium]|nr:hypothetical protein [Elusimicrobiota bacterium]